MSEDKTCHFNIGQARNACLCFSLATSAIQSEDASIKHGFAVNECGAYSRAAPFNLFCSYMGP